jgi:hypothetical protein
VIYSSAQPLQRVLAFCALFIPLLAIPSIAVAQADFFSELNVDINESDTGDSPFSILGWVTQELSYSFEQSTPPFSRTERQFSQVETSLYTQIDWRLQESLSFRFSGKVYHDAVYEIKDDTPFSSSERDLHRNRTEVRDFYLEKTFDNGLFLKAGHQVQAWGFAEYLRVTDLINTEDQYTFGQQDLEDLRLQVPALQLSFSWRDWVLDGVVTYHAGFNDLAPARDEFDQFIGLRRDNWLIDRRDPENDSEIFVRASNHYADGDIQIVAGEFNNNQLSFDRISIPESGNPVFHFSQERLQALGMAVNHVAGSWLVFGELGLHRNSPVMPLESQNFIRFDGWQERSRVLTAVGIEYSGFPDTLLSLEVDNIHTRGEVSTLGIERNLTSFGTRLYWTGWNERVQLVSVWNKLADDQGYLGRLSFDYDWSDNWKFGLLWVDYSAKRESIYSAFRNNDMLQLNARFSFQK